MHPSLEGNFAPVRKETRWSKGLRIVKGSLPHDLRGMFVRNGMNPQFPLGPGEPYHMWEGDGMVHAVKADGGSNDLGYVNRWIRTPKFEQEQQLKGKLRGKKAREIMFDLKADLANTSVTFHNGRMLALHEQHLPYAMEVLDSDFAMVGYEDFKGEVNSPFTAHPKLDPHTGEMIFFGYSLMNPSCMYGVVDKDGNLTHSLEIEYDSPVMMHDFAVTPKYTVIMVLPLVFSLVGTPPQPKFELDKSKASRFAVFPRYAKEQDEIQWFEHPVSTFAFHVGNAWDDGDFLQLVLCPDDDFDYDEIGKSGFPYKELQLARFSFHHPSGKVERTLLFDRAVEFPVVNPGLIGCKTEFVYVCHEGFDERVRAEEKPRLEKFLAQHRAKNIIWAVSKISTSTGRECGRIVFGEERTAGECAFARREGANGPDQGAAEDAGYLVTFVYDATTSSSYFVVYDAATMSPKPVCEVLLPAPVPFGAHGTWFGAHELRQKPLTVSEASVPAPPLVDLDANRSRL